MILLTNVFICASAANVVLFGFRVGSLLVFSALLSLSAVRVAINALLLTLRCELTRCAAGALHLELRCLIGDDVEVATGVDRRVGLAFARLTTVKVSDEVDEAKLNLLAVLAPLPPLLLLLLQLLVLLRELQLLRRCCELLIRRDCCDSAARSVDDLDDLTGCLVVEANELGVCRVVVVVVVVVDDDVVLELCGVVDAVVM